MAPEFHVQEAKLDYVIRVEIKPELLSWARERARAMISMRWSTAFRSSPRGNKARRRRRLNRLKSSPALRTHQLASCFSRNHQSSTFPFLISARLAASALPPHAGCPRGDPGLADPVRTCLRPSTSASNARNGIATLLDPSERRRFSLLGP